MIEMQLQSSRSKGSSYFIEELTNEQFISYEGLSQLVSINDGTLHNEGEGWLRFEIDGIELIVAKKPMRQAISWDQINKAGCVFGEKIVTINGNQYRVRLLKGADTDPAINALGKYLEGSHNSEWSRLFYPLVTDDSTLNAQYTGPKDPRYTNNDLGMTWVNEVTTPGAYSWCQEVHPEMANGRVFRGYYGVSFLTRNPSSTAGGAIGWRPVLELML